MAELTRPAILPSARASALILSGAGLAALIAVYAPGAMAAGGLAAWVFCLSATTGASVWLLIARLTGGAWTEAAGGALAAMSRSTPFVAPFGVLLFLAGPGLYPWWRGAEGSVGEIYLVPWFFGLRGAIILALWSILGWIAPRAPAPPLAAVLLIAYGVSVGFAGLDWILSRDPEMLSTAFGMLLAATQLGLALAVIAARGLERRSRRAVADWGGLLLACCLGNFYLGSMQFLVSWSGNLPFKAAWFGSRTDGIGTALMALVVLLGVVLPFAGLIRTADRGSPGVLRIAGASAAAAGLGHLVWLCAPDQTAAALLAAAAIVTIAAGLATLLDTVRPRHG